MKGTVGNRGIQAADHWGKKAGRQTLIARKKGKKHGQETTYSLTAEAIKSLGRKDAHPTALLLRTVRTLSQHWRRSQKKKTHVGSQLQIGSSEKLGRLRQRLRAGGNEGTSPTARNKPPQRSDQPRRIKRTLNLFLKTTTGK